jgi:hypothetical protein
VQDALSYALAEASFFLVGVVRLISNSGWDRPGLGDWSVRELLAARGRVAVAALGNDPLASIETASASVIRLNRGQSYGR